MQEDQSEDQSEEKQLAFRLVNTGYRILATELHPDKAGGSTEGMTQLNRIRDLLKAVIAEIV